jgi:hypothetical protein
LKYSQLITQPENLLAIGLIDVEIESETQFRLLKLGSVSPETPRADIHLNIHKINSIIQLILKFSQLFTKSENLLAIGLVDVEIESETQFRLLKLGSVSPETPRADVH